MKRLIIVGSPRTSGRSAHLAEMLFEANIDEHPEDELFLVPLSEIEVGPCIACDACREKTPVTFKNDSGDEVTEERHRCVFDDDMQTLYDLVDDADEITVVSPIFFSGAPAQLKCLLDRLQPYFWARLEAREAGSLPPKRPATLHVVGEGSDPHGYSALVSEVRSALAIADFRLERVLDWVGKIDEAGEITAEAEEVSVYEEAGFRSLSSAGAASRAAAASDDGRAGERFDGDLPGLADNAQRADSPDSAEAAFAASGDAERRAQNRPKLDLSAGSKKSRNRTGQSKQTGQSKRAGQSKSSASSAKAARSGQANRSSQSRKSRNKKGPKRGK